MSNPQIALGGGVVLSGAIGPLGAERWSVSPEDSAAGRAYLFLNHYSNKCMDIEDLAGTTGSRCTSGTATAVTARSGGSSVDRAAARSAIRIKVYADKCLDVTGFRNRAGTQLQILSCSGAWNQDFVFSRASG